MSIAARLRNDTLESRKGKQFVLCDYNFLLTMESKAAQIKFFQKMCARRISD